MLNIQIDMDFENEEEGQLYLEEVANQVGHGFVSGEGWTVTGDPEEKDTE